MPTAAIYADFGLATDVSMHDLGKEAVDGDYDYVVHVGDISYVIMIMIMLMLMLILIELSYDMAISLCHGYPYLLSSGALGSPDLVLSYPTTTIA